MSTIAANKDEDDHIPDLRPVVLLLIDGFGVAPINEGNVFSFSKTNTINKLIKDYPVTLLNPSFGSVNNRYLSMGTGVEFKEDVGDEIKLNCLSNIVANSKLKQLKIFSPERYVPLTHYFNGLREDKFELEDWQLVSGSKAKGDEKKNNTLTKEVFSNLIKVINSNADYKLISAAVPGIDICARESVIDSTKKEIERVDKYLNKLVEKVLEKGYTLLVSSAFGNAEKMMDMGMEIEDNKPTQNPVPVILISNEFKGLRAGKSDAISNDLSLLNPSGSLINIAPTILELLNLEQPNSMKGESLVKDLV